MLIVNMIIDRKFKILRFRYVIRGRNIWEILKESLVLQFSYLFPFLCFYLFHHLYQSYINSAVKTGEFPNDFANWAAYELADTSLAEKLASFNPYDFNDVSRAREKVAEIIEEHMWDLHTIPWVRPGSEFYFSSAT